MRPARDGRFHGCAIPVRWRGRRTTRFPGGGTIRARVAAHPAPRNVCDGAMSAWPPERSRHGGVDRIPLPRAAGQLWLCGKHFVAPDAEAALARVGAKTVVCLTEEHELAGRYDEYVRWLDDNAPERAVWFPIPDLHAPEVDAVSPFLADLNIRLRRGDTVLMHCGAGIGRAGTMAAAVLVTLGVAPKDAVATVAAHRPMAGPESGVQTEFLHALTPLVEP